MSPILFVVAFKVILIRARQVAAGFWLPAGRRLPPFRSYLDDITCFLQTALCTSSLFKRLDELITWVRMKIRPSKSNSLSLRRGKRNDNIIFTIAVENIPIIMSPSEAWEGNIPLASQTRGWGKVILPQLSEALASADTLNRDVRVTRWLTI